MTQRRRRRALRWLIEGFKRADADASGAVDRGEPHAIAFLLRRVERLEDVAHDFVGHADAGVADLDDDVAATLSERGAGAILWRGAGDAQREGPAVRHCVSGIQAEVEQRILQEGHIAADDRGRP